MAGLIKNLRLIAYLPSTSSPAVLFSNLCRKEWKSSVQLYSKVTTACGKCDTQRNHNDQSKTTFQHTQTRNQTSFTPAIEKEGLFRRIMNNYGYRMKYKRFDMMRAGLRLYLCTAELVDTEQFSKEFELPDTFMSWFTVVGLHVWMCMCRLKVEGREGKYVRNVMLTRMWEDVSAKAKKLGPLASASSRSEGLHTLNTVFQYSLLAYDEGILDHDRVLAAAIWRHFFYQKCDDPRKIEKLVHYIHKQLRHLEYQESETIVKHGLITYLPLFGDKVNKERNESILKEIWKRS